MFWDTSALVPLVVEEARTGMVVPLADGPRTTWWGTRVECVSALSRRRRDGSLDEAGYEAAHADVVEILDASAEVAPSESVRFVALRLVRTHPIRSVDALQLAAALDACDGRPTGQSLVALDDRLRTAARLEGFKVLPDLTPVSPA